ncbi:MAG: hypothetical protein Q7S20_06370 [Gemmatimonadaceae bacterium]|nr:hypothetical protein [Gemmatimonadaceae bacterium]
MAFAFALALVIAGCGQSSESRLDSTRLARSGPDSVAEPPAARTSGSNAGATACPHTGLWALCTVEKRLRQSGFVARRIEGESPKRAGFSVSPTVYSLGKSRLEIFLYKNEAALARDLSAMDTVLVAPRGTTAAWEMPPILIRSANLAAVILTANQRQAERVTLALTAGPPQPGSPR